MQLTEVLHGKAIKSHPLLVECTEFLKESEGLPVLKNLSINYDDFHKVKVRQRKRKDEFTKTFNEAFEDIPNLRQRSVKVNGTVSFVAESTEREPFYVFPIDGYRYKYSLEVSNSEEDYQEAFDVILELFDDTKVIEQLLKYTYTSENLVEGINHGSEIIFYNIPYFYAVKASSIDEYEKFLEELSNGTY